ncbi:MAG: DUF1080 domain-containing protein [Bacteroidetes bacterium]|nr:DUF1080 domain-containing protein [Bacteroidota bacterium]
MKKTLVYVFLFAVAMGFSQERFSKKHLFFTGVDFTNWDVPENNIWWSVTPDGELEANSDPDETGSTLWSSASFSDFTMRLEFKMGEGVVDSGVFIRGENPQNPQIQIGISGSLKRDMTGSPYVPSQGYPVEALKDYPNVLVPNDWNSMEIKAIKNVYEVWLNGISVLNYTLENANLDGPVGLQLHPGRTMDIKFKNIYLKPL